MKNEENSNNNKVERWPVDTWYRNNGDQGDSNLQNSAYVGSLFEVEDQVNHFRLVLYAYYLLRYCILYIALL